MPVAKRIPKEILEDLYINKRMTMKEICKELNISQPLTISTYMKKYGIKARDVNQERKLTEKMGITEKELKERMIDDYLNKKLSMIQMKGIYGVSHTIIKNYLVKFGATIRTKKEAMGLYAGEKSPNWNEGMRYHSFGYRQIRMPEHPNATAGYVYEHRYVMEQHIGRYLESHEVIHHINGIKTDNRIKNLQITTHSEHRKLEIEKLRKKKEKEKLG